MAWIDAELALTALAAMLSPTTLSFSIFALVLGDRPLRTGFWFYLGAMTATLAIGVVAAFVIGDAAASDTSTPKTWVAIVDLVAAGVKPLPLSIDFKRGDGSPTASPPRHALAVDTVRFVGEAIAAVIAQSAEEARDAAEAIDVRYEALPMVADLDDAFPHDAKPYVSHRPAQRMPL